MRPSFLGVVQSVEKPPFLFHAGDAPIALHVELNLPDVGVVPSDVRHVTVVLSAISSMPFPRNAFARFCPPRVECEQVNEIAKVKLPPDPAFVLQVNLAQRNPLVVSPFRIDSPLSEADSVVREGTASRRYRIIGIARPGFPVVVGRLVVVPNGNDREEAMHLDQVLVRPILGVPLSVVVESCCFATF